MRAPTSRYHVKGGVLLVRMPWCGIVGGHWPTRFALSLRCHQFLAGLCTQLVLNDSRLSDEMPLFLLRSGETFLVPPWNNIMSFINMIEWFNSLEGLVLKDSLWKMAEYVILFVWSMNYCPFPPFSELLAICTSVLLGISFLSAPNSPGHSLSQAASTLHTGWFWAVFPPRVWPRSEFSRFPLGLIMGRGKFSWWFLDKLSLASKKWEEESVLSKKLRS